jgi:lambda family phage portal protein
MYDDAELERKKNRAAFTGAIHRQAYDNRDFVFDPMSGQPIKHDQSGVPQAQVEAGTFVVLYPGEDIKTFDGDTTGQGYADFVRQQLLCMAAAQGIPFEFLTGDYKGVNDRLMRVILNEYHRLIEQFQWLVTIPQICTPVYNAFIDDAVLFGLLPAPGYATNRENYLKVAWHPHRWPYLNPEQDVNAAGLEIKFGLNSRTGAARERGLNAADIDRENAEDKERAEELGLSYETHANAQGGDDFGREGGMSRTSDDTEDPQRQSYNRLRRFRNFNARFYDRAA